jgi:hypothetical protein
VAGDDRIWLGLTLDQCEELMPDAPQWFADAFEAAIELQDQRALEEQAGVRADDEEITMALELAVLLMITALWWGFDLPPCTRFTPPSILFPRRDGSRWGDLSFAPRGTPYTARHRVVTQQVGAHGQSLYPRFKTPQFNVYADVINEEFFRTNKLPWMKDDR